MFHLPPVPPQQLRPHQFLFRFQCLQPSAWQRRDDKWKRNAPTSHDESSAQFQRPFYSLSNFLFQFHNVSVLYSRCFILWAGNIVWMMQWLFVWCVILWSNCCWCYCFFCCCSWWWCCVSWWCWQAECYLLLL